MEIEDWLGVNDKPIKNWYTCAVNHSVNECHCVLFRLGILQLLHADDAISTGSVKTNGKISDFEESLQKLLRVFDCEAKWLVSKLHVDYT